MLQMVIQCFSRSPCIRSHRLSYIAKQRFQRHDLSRLYSTENPDLNNFESIDAQLDFAELNFDAENVELIKTHAEEILNMKNRGVSVCDPSTLRRSDWEEILYAQSKSGRKKVYTFLFKKQMRKTNEKAFKEARKLDREEWILNKEETSNSHIVYKMGQTSILSRVRQSEINKWMNYRLFLTKLYGCKIILDCSYDAYMKRPEAKNTAKQITDCFSINRRHAEPFDLQICGADLDGHTMKCLQKHIPTLLTPAFPMEVHTGSPVDIFPLEKLVYLTPHCENDLEEFNHDDIYIIGGLVDKHHCFPVSLEKATALGLRMAKFPLEKYFHFKGDKTLTLDQVLKVMLDLKNTGSWQQAFKHLPRRKIVEQYNPAEEPSDQFTDVGENGDNDCYKQ